MFYKSILLAASLLISSAQLAVAQTKEVVKEQLATEVCACLTKKSAVAKPETLSKDQIKQVFIACFGGAAAKHMKGIQQAYGQTAFSNSALMRTLGEEVGALLLQNCPESMGYFMAIADKDDASKPAAATSGQTVGTLGALRQSGSGLAMLTVQTSKTEAVSFAWVRQFDKAEELLRKLPELQGKQVRVAWEEVEVLQPDTRQYQKVREITGIEVL
jgi:hypothetical protein